MTVNVSQWISLWPSFWPRALMGLNGAWKSKGAWTPLARSSVKIWSSGLIRTWDIKQQLFYGVNFCTEDFKRLSLLGSLFAKWFFSGRCSILLQRPIFTECEHFVPNLAMTLWCLELLHSLAQGTPVGCLGRAERVVLTPGSQLQGLLHTSEVELKNWKEVTECHGEDVSSAFPSH